MKSPFTCVAFLVCSLSAIRAQIADPVAHYRAPLPEEVTAVKWEIDINGDRKRDMTRRQTQTQFTKSISAMPTA